MQTHWFLKSRSSPCTPYIRSSSLVGLKTLQGKARRDISYRLEVHSMLAMEATPCDSISEIATMGRESLGPDSSHILIKPSMGIILP